MPRRVVSFIPKYLRFENKFCSAGGTKLVHGTLRKVRMCFGHNINTLKHFLETWKKSTFQLLYAFFPAFVLDAGWPNYWSGIPSYSFANISVAKMMIPAPGRAASQKHVDFILVDICRHRQISTTFQFHISPTGLYIIHIAPALATLYIFPTQKRFLTINAMRREAQQLI